MRNITNCENRLREMLIADKRENPSKIERLLKSELYYLLRNYFEFNSEDFTIEIAVNEFGKFEFNISGVAASLKKIHTF